MSTSRIGNGGLVATAKEFVLNGFEVFTPLTDNASCDLIVVKDGEIHRVECKSTDTMGSGKSWLVQLRSIRSNRTKNTIKHFDGKKSDILSVYIEKEDRVVLLKSIDYHGRATVSIEKAT